MGVEQEREQAHGLIDRLQPAQLTAVRNLLETMIDPVHRYPVEDEEIGDEEQRTVADSIEWLKHNPGIPHSEILAEFGLERIENSSQASENAKP